MTPLLLRLEPDAGELRARRTVPRRRDGRGAGGQRNVRLMSCEGLIYNQSFLWLKRRQRLMPFLWSRVCRGTRLAQYAQNTPRSYSNTPFKLCGSSTLRITRLFGALLICVAPPAMTLSVRRKSLPIIARRRYAEAIQFLHKGKSGKGVRYRNFGPFLFASCGGLSLCSLAVMPAQLPFTRR